VSDAKKRTLIKLDAVKQRTGVGKTTIYGMIGRGEFPAPVPLGSMARWVEDEIDAWVNARIMARDACAS
jgi:prophage regulatory protein